MSLLTKLVACLIPPVVVMVVVVVVVVAVGFEVMLMAVAETDKGSNKGSLVDGNNLNRFGMIPCSLCQASFWSSPSSSLSSHG